jgi:hypothetical protein
VSDIWGWTDADGFAWKRVGPIVYIRPIPPTPVNTTVWTLPKTALVTDREKYEAVQECSERINAAYKRIDELRREHPDWFPLFTDLEAQ